MNGYFRSPRVFKAIARTSFCSHACQIAASASIALLAITDDARADGLDGTWKQGPLREEYTVQQWLSACGPAPVSGSSNRGDSATIQEDADELVIVSKDRTFRTNECFDPLPTLSRETHSRETQARNTPARTWRTRCATPVGDPRRAVINTLVVAPTPTHIELLETGRYEITLREGRCIADVKRSKTFDRIAPLQEPQSPPQLVAPPASSPTALPASSPDTVPPSQADEKEQSLDACESPGSPSTLEVRPSRKLLRAGESYTFKAIVRDANGCVTKADVDWTTASRSDSAADTTDAASDGEVSVGVDSHGKVSAPRDSAEGSVDIVVTAGGKSVHVTVVVTSPAKYDELLARSDLNDAGEANMSSTVAITTSSTGGAGAQAEDSGQKRRAIFIAVVGTISLALFVLALVARKRAKKAERIEKNAADKHMELVRQAEEKQRERIAEHAAQIRAHEESLARAVGKASFHSSGLDPNSPRPMMCPTCRQPAPAGSIFCPSDGNRLIVQTEPSAGAPSGGVCPACSRGFDPGVRMCPHDGEEIIPYGLHASAQSPPKMRGKICPTCGGRFDGNATFCGKDGTALVLIN